MGHFPNSKFSRFFRLFRHGTSIVANVVNLVLGLPLPVVCFWVQGPVDNFIQTGQVEIRYFIWYSF